ncbi:outer membrane receptor for ferrienterochelin and colicins [Flavobacterium sp. 28YEA47A]|uniref:TonB-dependent receptor domain-containing protein n=1 Tax=Flavobacterium sp. 28YEA47A TaxID=3156276 RepID=UPI003513ED0D
MKNLKFAITLLLLSVSLLSYAQERPQAKKVKITGKITEKSTSQPLGYATVTLQNSRRPDVITGGMTDENGEFSIEANAGTYDVKFEFISFKPIEIKQLAIQEDKNFGTIALEAEAEMLDAVEIRAERSTVEIKLDKKVYNVGQDMIVKGGTISDVLDNVPSVSVDVEGNVSLRGNENVRILIDGKPSGLAGINIADALKMLPADAVDKVEVITNPSARYDAEGGAGILNIILKKGKNQGINGTVTATTGDPANHGFTGTINYKTEQFNLFTTQGYSYRKGPGNSMTDTEYLDENGDITGYLKERRNNERLSKSYNGVFGVEWYLDKSTTWTNTLSYRRSSGENPDNVFQYRYDPAMNLQSITNRFNMESEKDENVDFSSNFIKKFKKDGHQLTVDLSFSQSDDDENSDIPSRNVLDGTAISDQRTGNIQKQNRSLLQTDYVLPIGEKSQFEAGYRGNFNNLLTDYSVENFNYGSGAWENDPQFTNTLEYKEKVNAFYSQFGTKINRMSYLVGLRWEDSNIDINQLTQNIYKNKRYNNFFPSAFLTYEFNESSSASLSYSRRISRPRSRSINPFSSLSSNINLFRGNPDLDPSMTDALDFGYLNKFGKLTFNTSMYFNRTKDAVQYVRNTEIINGISTLVTSPVNVGSEDRFGFEFTLSYNPYKWWRLNSNFNLFRNQTKGNYTYTDLSNNSQTIDFSNTAYSWFARINSKINLPLGIDWQANTTYNAPQTNAQGRSKGIISANMAFSKDVLKDKGTVALNVNDLFNSRKRITETNLATQNAYSEMQWRERQITLSFTYRFNKKKNEREKQPKRTDGDNGGEEYMGG